MEKIKVRRNGEQISEEVRREGKVLKGHKGRSGEKRVRERVKGLVKGKEEKGKMKSRSKGG